MPIEPILPHPETDRALRYSPGMHVRGEARTLYVSGQVGIDRAGTIPPDCRAQSELAFANLLAVLEAADMGVRDLVKLTVFLTAPADFADFVAVRAAVLADHKPASTLVYVSGLARPEWKVEVEAIACVVAPA